MATFTKADFRSLRRRLIRGANRIQKNLQRGNKRGLAYFDTLPAKRCAVNFRLKDCDLLTA